MMRTDELIRSLTGELQPVQPLPSVERRTVSWAVLAMMCASLGTLALGVRADLAQRIRDPAFLGEGVLLLAIFILSARSAFQLSVPGAGPDAKSRTLAVCGLLLWGSLLAASASGESSLVSMTSRSGVRCLVRLSGLALAPAAAILLMLRRAAPSSLRWTGCFALLAAASLAVVATRMVCPRDGVLHVALWHFLPVLAVAAAGTRIGRRVLRPRRTKR